jgi:hypothetical protein
MPKEVVADEVNFQPWLASYIPTKKWSKFALIIISLLCLSLLTIICYMNRLGMSFFMLKLIVSYLATSPVGAIQNFGCGTSFWEDKYCGLNGINCLPFHSGIDKASYYFYSF